MAELDDLLKEREALEERIKEVSRRDRLDALNTCRDLIKKFDFQPAELGLKRIMRKGAAVPKYMGPNGQTANRFGFRKLNCREKRQTISK